MEGVFECVVLERFQPSAPVAHQVVMVLVGGVAALRLVPRDAVADVHAGEQVEADELVHDAVDRGAADAPAFTGAQTVLDVQRGQRAGLVVEQLDHRLTGATAPVPGAGELLQSLFRPLCHRAQ